MAKRESIWKANDGSEHRSKQSAAVADAEHAIKAFTADVGDSGEHVESSSVSDNDLIAHADEFLALLTNLAKARAALVKHEGKAE